MLPLIAFLCTVSFVNGAHKHRHEQLGRMKQYSLLNLSPEIVDRDTRLLEFVAFEQHYVVELTRKMNWAPSAVRHRNVDEDVHAPLSSVEESCHFSGRVLNFADSSVVSASFCEGRGIRARITAFGETLMMKPSAYFLDLEADKVANHSLDGEVLVYRVSDFDKPMTMVTDEAAAPSVDGVDLTMSADGVDDEALRRRRYSAGNPAETEIAVVIGPVRTRNYQDDYGANWYSQLYQDTVDIMNAVDEIYANTNWNLGGRNSVGAADSLRVVLSEIYVIYSFTGIHSGMAPTKRFTSCPLAANEYDDSNDCAVVGNEWLGLIQQWIGSNMDTAEYDNVQFITDIMFNWSPCSYSSNACGRTLGWGSVGTVCRGTRSSAVNSVAYDFGGNDNVIGTIAHELGHNFGLRHDGQPGPASSCCANCGLMGYGNNDDTFSECSLDLMEQYFNGDGDFLQCLGVGWDGNVVSNVDDGESANPSPTAAPVHSPSTTSSSSATTGCLNVEMGLENYDGTWLEVDGGFGGHEAYSFVNPQGAIKYLYYKELVWSSDASKWAISETLGTADYINLICTEQYLYECTANWKYPGGAILADSVTDYHCDPDDVVDDSCDSSYSRICVTGSGPHGAYDGYYDASECYNGTRYYNGSRGNYLCYDAPHSQWTISWTLCDRGNIVSQTTTAEAGVLDPSYWLYSSTGSSYHNYDDDMMVYDCSYHNNGALNLDDLSCLDEKAYGDEICFSTNNSLWNGDSHRTFKLYQELCSNEEPIYHFVQYNDSKSLLLPSGEVLDAEVEATFYVHFELVYPTVTDNETVGQWWLSKDEMAEHNRMAFCEEEDLMQCTSNRWNVKVTSPGMDGTIFSVLDDFSSVLDGHCDSHFEAELSTLSDGSNLSAELITVIVAALLFCVAVLCAVGLCSWRRLKHQQYRNDALKVQQCALDAEEVHAVKEVDDGDETTEITVDVDVDAIRI